MKAVTSIAAIAAFLSSTALAQSKAYSPYISSSDPKYHGLPVVAWNGQFIVDDDTHTTTAACPYWDTNCGGKNVTILGGLQVDDLSGPVWMGITQQGGQKVYWHSAPIPTDPSYSSSGYMLSYTAASDGPDASIPVHNVEGDAFRILSTPSTGASIGHPGGLKLATTRQYEGNEIASTIFGMCGLDLAYGESYKRITVSSGKYCTMVEIELKETNAPAPVFYECAGCEFRTNRTDRLPCVAPFCHLSPSFYS